jgi:hypothetical protein
MLCVGSPALRVRSVPDEPRPLLQPARKDRVAGEDGMDMMNCVLLALTRTVCSEIPEGHGNFDWA